MNLIIRIAPLSFAVLWSSGFVAAKLAVTGAEPLTFLSVRNVAAATVLALIAIVSRAPWTTTPRLIGHALVAGALLHGGYLSGVWWAVSQGVPAGVSALITGAQPLLTAMLAGPLLGERVTPRHWGGIVIGFLGIVLVLSPRLAQVDTGHLATVLTPILVNCGATLSVTLGTFYQKQFATGMDLRSGTCLQFVGALMLTAPLALATEHLHFEITAATMAALGWSVLVLSTLGVALLLLLIRHGEVSRVASLIYLVPPLVALQAYVAFGETLSTVQLAGMAIAAAGVWLATRRR